MELGCYSVAVWTHKALTLVVSWLELGLQDYVKVKSKLNFLRKTLQVETRERLFSSLKQTSFEPRGFVWKDYNFGLGFLASRSPTPAAFVTETRPLELGSGPLWQRWSSPPFLQGTLQSASVLLASWVLQTLKVGAAATHVENHF